MEWKVKNYNTNRDKIEDYDVLEYFENFLRELKKKKKTQEEFAEEIRGELKYRYWSKCEYELIIEIRDHGRIILLPWCGCRDAEAASIDVTCDESFDWKGFADKHIDKQIYKNKAKIDIWDQIEYRFDEFVLCCWNEIHKTQNKKHKL